jgi:adenosylmethionine-8-amino-7-oxononanoate aminotransferase
LVHGPTFMGNALACAAAHASLDLFEREPRLEQAAAVGAALRDGLAPCKDLPWVKDVRTLGAIGVVELTRVDDMNRLKQRLIDQRVWVRPFGRIVYLTPALTIAPDDLERLINAVNAVVAAGTP